MKFEEALEIIRLAPNYTLSQHTEPEVAIKRSCWHEHRMVVRSDDTLFVIVKHYTENENSWFLEEWKECAADLLANDWEIKQNKPLDLSGVQLIRAERDRQIEVEGYTRGHDLQHQDCELAKAACAYLLCYLGQNDEAIEMWPFDEEEFKPSETPEDNSELVKAGALVAAQIDFHSDFAW